MNEGPRRRLSERMTSKAGFTASDKRRIFGG